MSITWFIVAESNSLNHRTRSKEWTRYSGNHGAFLKKMFMVRTTAFSALQNVLGAQGAQCRRSSISCACSAGAFRMTWSGLQNFWISMECFTKSSRLMLNVHNNNNNNNNSTWTEQHRFLWSHKRQPASMPLFLTALWKDSSPPVVFHH